MLVTQNPDIQEHAHLTMDGEEFVPYSPKNNLLTHRVLLLPSDVGPSTETESLLDDVRTFIHRYVDVSKGFEEVAAHYVLLTWRYDSFNEVPYLRVRGDYGSGKSRFLLTVGSLCWKPIFASGASTVSPLFRLIDQVGGTLVVDEADFWASDERAEIVKILNNGNARGFPVLRSEVTPQKEFNPRAFNIFGPKVVATRHVFEDAALESRCLTEVIGGKPLREDIPISLPDCFEQEADGLRNKLLRYRLDHVHDKLGEVTVAATGLEPRRVQVLRPLLHVAASDASRRRMEEFVSREPRSAHLRDRELCRQVLVAVASLMKTASVPLTVGAVTEKLRSSESIGWLGDLSPKSVGVVLRRLGLEPQKSNGTYRIPVADHDLVMTRLVEYGLGDFGDIGDVSGPFPQPVAR